MRWIALTVTSVCLLGVLACGDTNSGSAAGSEGGACYPNGTCDTNLVCLSNLCVSTESCQPGAAMPCTCTVNSSGVAECGADERWGACSCIQTCGNGACDLPDETEFNCPQDCAHTASCGDNVAYGDLPGDIGYEICDGSDLRGQTCASLGQPVGTLACTADCTWDFSACVEPGCGNGLAETGEACDGSDINGQTCETLGHDYGVLTCTATCSFETSDCHDADCGNGLMEAGEDCDSTDLGGMTCVGLGEGFTGGVISCLNCQYERSNCFSCGNNLVEATEACDDGNLTSCDGCSDTCQVEECGNGIPECGEICDDGNVLSGDGCSSDCASDESCGNGYVDASAGEQCDAGGGNSNLPNSACRTDCRQQRCGDGVLDDQLNEICDDGNAVSGDGCSGDCLSNETCGNSYQDVGEQCDDGNTTSGDGCSGDCLSSEACGNGVLDSALGEQCDDGNTNDCDGCRGDCSADETGCGDGFICGSEVCDDGNNSPMDGCSAVCTEESGWTCGGEPSICTLGCTQPEALYLQSGCNAGEMCTVTAFSGGSYTCISEGTTPYYGWCTGYQSCVAGSACANVGTGNQCLPYCDINDSSWNCPMNGADHALCLYYYPQGQTVSGVCAPNQCDAVVQTGCSTGWCDRIADGVAFCEATAPPGQVGLHGACVESNPVGPSESCQPGLLCINTGSEECLQLCRHGQSDCTVGGETCNPWNPPDPVYGVCQ